MFEKNRYLEAVLIAAIILLAAFFRLYGLNWDQGQHLHPDERFLTMVANDTSWPNSLSAYLDTDHSLLNPHNKTFSFYVYGTLPFIIVKCIAESLRLGDYGGITLVGRFVSAIMDIGTILVIFAALKISSTATNLRKKRLNLYLPIITAFFYACTVLSIQLSHFFAVDTFLTFFITFAFFGVLLMNRASRASSPALPIISGALITSFSFGLALSCKISAVFFLPIIALGFLTSFIRMPFPLKKRVIFYILLGIISSIVLFITLRLGYPYLFKGPGFFDIQMNPKVLNNWKELTAFNDPNTTFPPGVQWVKTKPYLFPLKNMVLWGLGLPISLLALSGIIWFKLTLLKEIENLKHRKQILSIITQLEFITVILSLSWIVILFGYQGKEFVKALRYFHSIYPFVCLFAAYGTIKILGTIPTHRKIFLILILFITLIYPFAFITIYSRHTTRVMASQWIFNNIPAGSVLSMEHWDDPLPLNLPDFPPSQQYRQIEFPLYGVDSDQKWQMMIPKLQQVDYIIMSSNRLFGSLTTDQVKYPLTTKYYQALFDGSLGFKKIAEFTSRPNVPIPGIHLCLTPPLVHYGTVALPSQQCPLPGVSFVDDYADETFTVYDHPKVVIFKKITPVNYDQVLFR